MALKTEKYRKYYLKCSNTFFADCMYLYFSSSYISTLNTFRAIQNNSNVEFNDGKIKLYSCNIEECFLKYKWFIASFSCLIYSTVFRFLPLDVHDICHRLRSLQPPARMQRNSSDWPRQTRLFHVGPLLVHLHLFTSI